MQRQRRDLIARSVFLFGMMIAAPAMAGPIPQGDTQVTQVSELYKVSFGLQYRVMYNASNIPFGSLFGPGGTVPEDTKGYDFFRQRMRLNIDIQPAANVGGFIQLEYRGGWGGSSPAQSDPRDLTQLNAFNRLQARGVRYGYIYATPWSGHTVAAGVLPLSDQVGDTLFSADWDFNVGGVTLFGKAGAGEYRAAFVRLIEGLSSNIPEELSREGDFYVLDYTLPVNKQLKLGGHLYYLDVDRITALPADLRDVQEAWLAATLSGKVGIADVNGFLILNAGRDFKESGVAGDHTGFAFKLEGSIPLGSGKLSLLGLYATGDAEGTIDKRFVTPQEIAGTQGYWAYTHLFTANGPSDVNDLGVRIGNSGAGLLTLQAKYEFPLMPRLSGQAVVGWFQAAEARARTDGVRAVRSRDMGTELSGMLTLSVMKGLNLQAGAAYARLGEFFGPRTDNLYEVFTRFQLQF